MEYNTTLDAIKIHWMWITIDDLLRLKDWPTKDMYNYAVETISSHIWKMGAYWITELHEIKEDKYVLKKLMNYGL